MILQSLRMAGRDVKLEDPYEAERIQPLPNILFP